MLDIRGEVSSTPLYFFIIDVCKGVLFKIVYFFFYFLSFLLVTMLLKLPLELREKIVRSVCAEDIKQMSAVCKSWYGLFSFFHRVSLNCYTLSKFYADVEMYPSIMLKIKGLRIGMYVNYQVRESLAILKNVLHSCSNLEVLEFEGSQTYFYIRSMIFNDFSLPYIQENYSYR